MQINYARYPGVVGNDWPGAEQNPAYSSSAKSAPRRIFLVTRDQLFVTYDQLFVTCDQLFMTCVFPLSLRVKRSNPVNIVRATRDILQPWIATPSAMARDDKVWCIVVLLSQVLHTVSLRATRSNPDTFTSYPWLAIRDL